jgi:hypothetical protein
MQCATYRIRNFCDPETPIFMFDKDEKFVVKTLEEVRDYLSIVQRSLLMDE